MQTGVTQGRNLYNDLPIDNKVFIHVACASHQLVWENQHMILMSASKGWLRHGTFEGYASGAFSVDAKKMSVKSSDLMAMRWISRRALLAPAGSLALLLTPVTASADSAASVAETVIANSEVSVSVDHFVSHISTMLANRGEHVQLFERESASHRPRLGRA
jgi:hypothetical protein